MSNSTSDPSGPASPPHRRLPQQPHQDQELNLSEMGSFSEIFEPFDDDDMSTFTSTTSLAVAGHQHAGNFQSSSAGDADEPTAVPSFSVAETINGNDNPTGTSDPDAASSAISRRVIPNKNDVLLGRGGKNNQHSGNEQLRHMAREMSHTYAAAPKRNKPTIAWLLVTKLRTLNPPGRYVSRV